MPEISESIPYELCDMNPLSKTEIILALLAPMPPGERKTLIDQITDDYCPGCGSLNHPRFQCRNDQ